MNLFLKLVNFYIYSSLHIGIATVALIYQTCQVYGVTHNWYYSAFAFCSTVFIYCAHRTIGIKRMPDWHDEGRFTIIKTYKTHIEIYAVLGLLGCGILFFFLPHQVKFLLVLPSIFSVAYVLPIFKNKFRLRDFNYIKIFLIAIVWAYITVTIPILSGGENSLSYYTIALISLERMLFVFAITIPFDIRDYEIDKEANVNTLVHKFGIEGSKKLSIVLVFFSLLINFTLRSNGVISDGVYLQLLIFYILLIFIIIYASKYKSDYLYSGVLDGTMILSPLMIYFFA